MRKLYKILLLNMWHSVQRSRYTLPILTAILAITLVSAGILAVNTFNVTGESLASVMRGGRENESTPTLTGGLSASKQQSLPSGRQSPSSDATTKTDASVNAKTGQAAGTQAASEDFKVAAIVVDPLTTVCEQGERIFRIKSAVLAFSGKSSAEKTLRWHWESRIDSGQSPEGIGPMPTDIHTQTLDGTGQEVVLKDQSADSALLALFPSSNYGYSFRLHVLTPNDSVSSWMTIPQGDHAC